MAYPRVSGRLGNELDLNVTFYRNGVATDPYAIRKVEVYKSSVQEENLVAIFPITDPTDDNYPSPLTKTATGVYHLLWDVPPSGIVVPDIFFDVWHYIADGGGSSGGSGSGEPVDISNEDAWLRSCNEFWLYSDGFFVDSGLTNIRLGFEALDHKFNQPEIRTLEVGLMPLPLYDFEYNKIAPIIPQMSAFFNLSTDNNELLINSDHMSIGLRQGTYRSNPFTLKYRFDTRKVLKGSYQYWVTVHLPNGESRTSPKFAIQVS